LTTHIASDQKRFELSVAVERLERLERGLRLEISPTRALVSYLTGDCYLGTVSVMNLRDFAQHIKKESTTVLLHRARKASLKRIMAHEETLEASRKKSAKKRAGSR
jgi:hypothetical protein